MFGLETGDRDEMHKHLNAKLEDAVPKCEELSKAGVLR